MCKISEMSGTNLTENGSDLPKSPSQEDIFEKIIRISDKYSFSRKKPIAVRAEEEGQLTSTSEKSLNEPNIIVFFKKTKTKTLDNQLEKIVYKNQILEPNTIKVLNEALEGYKNLRIVKFEFCGVTAEQLRLLDKLLFLNDTIEELSINGNPIKDQNYSRLLKHKLKSFSLKLCGVNTQGARKICKELSTPYENPLLHLNLACNALFDDGVGYIARMLRLNRRLISLNLADNKIRDEGLVKLLNPLQKFELIHDEVIVRRMFKLEYQKKLMGSSLNIENKKFRGFGKAKIQRFNSAQVSQGAKNDKPPKSSLSSKTKSAGSPNIPRVLPELPIHPLLQESVEENESIYCKGNNVLVNLNLAYNRITDQVVPKIITMLQYQLRQLDVVPTEGKTGLSRLSLVGNEISSDNLQNIKSSLQDKPFIILDIESMCSRSVELHKVFVYGTLKRGEPNHSWFSKSVDGYYKFIGNGKTNESFPLIISTKYNVPFILESPGNGTRITGEVYEVDDKSLADLDILEDHPNFYVREKFDVSLLNKDNSTVQAWIYVIKKFNPKLLNEPFYESYSSNGPHGKKYVERYLRDGSLDYREMLF